MFAIALYNNQAETEDELNFNKDDLLEVIEFDYEGLEGWWLCKLNNKTGLAAGNRLKIINIKQKDFIIRNNAAAAVVAAANIQTKQQSNASTISTNITGSPIKAANKVNIIYVLCIINSNSASLESSY